MLDTSSSRCPSQSRPINTRNITQLCWTQVHKYYLTLLDTSSTNITLLCWIQVPQILPCWTQVPQILPFYAGYKFKKYNLTMMGKFHTYNLTMLDTSSTNITFLSWTKGPQILSYFAGHKFHTCNPNMLDKRSTHVTVQ